MGIQLPCQGHEPTLLQRRSTCRSSFTGHAATDGSLFWPDDLERGRKDVNMDK